MKKRKFDYKCPQGQKDCFIDFTTSYSKWGWTLFLIGMSACPTKVTFKCQECGLVVAEITDKEKLQEYVGK